jgi:hypothetical protein
MRPQAPALFKQICPQDKLLETGQSKHDIFTYTMAASLKIGTQRVHVTIAVWITTDIVFFNSI